MKVVRCSSILGVRRKKISKVLSSAIPLTLINISRIWELFPAILVEIEVHISMINEK